VESLATIVLFERTETEVSEPELKKAEIMDWDAFRRAEVSRI
jgi:hypothetical protein